MMDGEVVKEKKRSTERGRGNGETVRNRSEEGEQEGTESEREVNKGLFLYNLFCSHM